jgi:hypothetical protein
MKPHDKIWLEPECDECDERCWSCAPFDDCEECGKETIGYVRDDIILASTAEASRMFDRIEKLEAALRDCVNVLACFERPDFYQLEQTSPIKPYALGALDVSRKALEGKDG